MTCDSSDTLTAYRCSERCSLIFVVSNQTEQELLCLTNTSPVDLLCEPVPSCLPSPQLRPDPVVLESADLIQFEERPAPLPGKSLPPFVASNQADEFSLSILLPNSKATVFSKKKTQSINKFTCLIYFRDNDFNRRRKADDCYHSSRKADLWFCGV